MKAVARQAVRGKFTHRISARDHEIVADEPATLGGEDEGATPQELLAASLAACTAITMEMYAERKGWEIDPIEVECEYEQAERGAPTDFRLTLRLPSTCSEEQRARLAVIAAKCPVHRTLEGPTTFEQLIEPISP